MESELNPYQVSLEHAEARNAKLSNDLALARRELEETKAELARWRRRCEPVWTDARDAGLTAYGLETWLREHGWIEQPPADRWTKMWPMWRGPNGEEIQAGWRGSFDTAKMFEELAAAVSEIAGLLDLDQWTVLAETAVRRPLVLRVDSGNPVVP